MIAVTGANGLLGSFIIRKLIETNKPFVAIKREKSDISLLDDVSSLIQWRDANVEDPVSLDEAFQDVTQVIHTAAIVSFNPAKAKKIYNVNVLGTRNVVNACLHHKVSKLIHISSVAALGRQKGQTLIDEKNKWTESSVNSVYAESKYLAELEVFRAQEEGLASVVLNPSVILAPGDWSRSSAQLFKYVWQGKRFYIDSNLNYVDARDVADVVHAFIDNNNSPSGRFVLNAGSIPFKDFFNLVALEFKKRPPSICLSKGVLQAAAFVETLRSNIAGTEPLITKETARLAGNHFLYNSEKIKKTLNFRFKTLEETLSWCAPYYLNYLSKN